MSDSEQKSVEVTIQNRMGFHVRPVQRFAETARVFRSDVEVAMKGRTVPGKSVINLVSLGGRCGDKMTITATGEDARQCVDLLSYLADSRFFVEDHVDVSNQPNRHVDRLVRAASVFDSDIEVRLDGKSADAKDCDAVTALGLTPTSLPEFDVAGEDAEQARAVLDNLVASCFYVEDRMAERERKAE
jgi:phosphotransferase system HPr (HPr) family protein